MSHGLLLACHFQHLFPVLRLYAPRLSHNQQTRFRWGHCDLTKLKEHCMGTAQVHARAQ